MAAMVSTEATMAMCAMKVLNLQKMVPNIQSLEKIKHEKSLLLVYYFVMTMLKGKLWQAAFYFSLVFHVDKVENTVEERVYEIGKAEVEDEQVCDCSHFWLI